MKYITRFEKNVPMPTSNLRVRIAVWVAPLRAFSVLRPDAFSSSTSCVACQKNRYGLIVVPRMATSVSQPSLPRGIEGIKVSCRAAFQSGWITNALITYAKSTRASHFKDLAIW
jgi:hypothetical protein